MKSSLLLVCLCLVSCMSLVERKTTDLVKNTVVEENKAFVVGGKFANRWGKGAIFNGEKSFRDLAVVAGAAVTGYVSAANTAAKEVTAQVGAKESATTARAATAAQVEIQKSADATAVKMAEIQAGAPAP